MCYQPHAVISVIFVLWYAACCKEINKILKEVVQYETFYGIGSGFGFHVLDSSLCSG